ncbi:hypothetical protein M885DRAFT_576680 [Pelagophyceae sp. CCMP2097]|nr:hypothetical protein M885DRAFT_576680 [Pelagophyceae sp. CCMP2097]
MLRRAAATLGGVYAAWTPGTIYVMQHPHCIGLRHLIGYPSDDGMLGSLAADGLVYGPEKILAALFQRRGVAVALYETTEGKNEEENKKIKWLKMGNETVQPLYPTPVDQMASQLVVSASAREFILPGCDDGAARRVSVDPVRRHRGIPAQVQVTIHDGTGGRVSDADDAEGRSYALASIYDSMQQVDAQGGISLTIGRKYRRGGTGDVVLVQKVKDQTGSSRQTKWRHVRGVGTFVRTGCSNEQADALMARVARRSTVFKEMEQMLDDKVSDAPRTFFDAESKYIYNLVATKSMYRELASVLRLKYGVRVLLPIDQISVAVKSQLSSATPGTIFIDVEEAVTEKDSVKKVNKVTVKNIDFWYIDSVAAELVLALNAVGKSFLRRRIAGKRNVIWILLGGDKGGKLLASFKLGFIVLNQGPALSALNVKLIGVVHGPDTRSVLLQTVMTPVVAAQLAELKHSVVLHVVSAAHRGSDDAPDLPVRCPDAAHGCLVIPEKIVVATTTSTSPVFVFLDDNDTLRTVSGPDEAPASECMGVLAVRDGFIIGLVVIHCNSYFGRSLLLNIAASGECFSFNETCFFGDVLAFYGLAEPLRRGGVVFVETLELAQKLTADHELYRVVFGQQGSNARNLCWACETNKTDERNEVGRAKGRTHAPLVACAALFPQGSSKGTLAYQANKFCSIEFPPLLHHEPIEETSGGPLPLVLGEFLRIYKVLAAKCAEIDGGVVDAAAAARISQLLLACKERCAELDHAVIEVRNEQRTLEKALAAATARGDKAFVVVERLQNHASSTMRPERRRNAPKALVGAELLLEEARAEAETSRVALAHLSELLADAVAAKKRAHEARVVAEANAAVALGPIAQCLAKMLDDLHVNSQAFYQMFIGIHCYKLLSNARQIFAKLGAVAREASGDAAATLEAFAEEALPLWESLYTVTHLSLAARMLTVEYQRLAYASDTSNALKRHMYTHLWEFAEKNMTAGLFAESAFESIHARYNAIERRYLGMIGQHKRDVAVRQALAPRTKPMDATPL